MTQGRKKLLKQIEANRKMQEDLAAKEIELCKQYIQISDEKQWYSEFTRTIGRGKNKRTIVEGRFHWMQDFKDTDTGRVFSVERSRVVKENDEWDNVAIVNLVI